ncbi:unnamed protein product [Arctia plantaginis]|uniref:Uncharacterized protein n=1 Tax=Arctia plantaginis TaxID=874455 RepID=A0A8S0YSL0_ARCPL|nr:unnamed protein product [Arctia plantaginis]
MTLDSLSKVSDEKRRVILEKIERKLKGTAKSLTNGDKYVKMIMQAFKDKANAKNKKRNDLNEKTKIKYEIEGTEDGIIHSNEHKYSKINKNPKTIRLGSKNVDKKSQKGKTNRKVFEPQVKEKIIRDIANKIDLVAKSYLRDSQTIDEKKAILKKIEERIMASSKRKHLQIHDQHSDLKAYTELIKQGLELSMNRLASKNRRMLDTDSEETEEAHDIGYNETHEMSLKQIKRYKAFFSEVLSESSVDPRCTEMVEGICLRIESMHKLPCGDGKYIELEQLCDGVFDCWNEADETNCTDKDESITTKCLQPLVGTPIFSRHHKTLLNMLLSQLDFLKKYKPPTEKYNITSKAIEDGDKFFMKKTIGDVTSIVSSLSSALEINLCLPSDVKAKENVLLTRRDMDSEIPNSKDEKTSTWSPKSCSCKREVCELDNCDARCKRICWQKFRLNRWKCQSVSGDASIPLGLICDGKLDCFDESDETLCAMGSNVNKFKANTLFNELIDLLSLKSISGEFEYSRNKMAALTGLARQLQKLATSSDIDLHAIKMTRDEYFKMLVHIYSDAMRHSNLQELDQTHDFLILLNEKMIGALKRSHTGNENVVPSAGCYCRNGTCVQVRCPPKCHATCQAEPFLTRYSCNTNNLTVPVKSICNGKKDCPNEEDEKNCLKDVCRSYHLILLRRNLKKAVLSLHGTAAREAINSWKSKVMITLQVVETRERPNHMLLEDTVINILHDLVSTYASMDANIKNSAERIFKEFVNVSNVVKETLKSCGN